MIQLRKLIKYTPYGFSPRDYIRQAVTTIIILPPHSVADRRPVLFAGDYMAGCTTSVTGSDTDCERFLIRLRLLSYNCRPLIISLQKSSNYEYFPTVAEKHVWHLPVISYLSFIVISAR